MTSRASMTSTRRSRPPGWPEASVRSTAKTSSGVRAGSCPVAVIVPARYRARMTASPDQAKGARGAESAGPDWRTLHLWQIQPVRDMLAILGVVGIVYLGSLV